MMPFEASQGRPLSAPTPRYEVLLEERIDAGRRLVRALMHPELAGEIPALWRAVCTAEAPLLRFRRYMGRDYMRRVLPAEDATWHTPGTDSACGGCVRANLALAEPLPVPWRRPEAGPSTEPRTDAIAVDLSSGAIAQGTRRAA